MARTERIIMRIVKVIYEYSTKEEMDNHKEILRYKMLEPVSCSYVLNELCKMVWKVEYKNMDLFQ